MSHCQPQRIRRQLQSQLQQLASAGAVPFADLLPAEQIRNAARAEGHRFRDRLFSPWLTVWLFLSQLFDADHSCRQVVKRLLAFLLGHGLRPCADDRSGYCKARRRLPEGLLARLTRDTGRRRHDEAPLPWRWHGRQVHVADGTTVSMPDTTANQDAFPQASSQKLGVGFPIARLVVVFSLAVGTVLDAALGRYQGKETGEPALLRQLHGSLHAADVLLADCCYCSYLEIALLQRQGVAVVLRQHQRRHTDFRTGCRLGRRDHLVLWHKPERPDWLDERTYAALPEVLILRELAVRVVQQGFRTKSYVVVTTLHDPVEFTAAEVATLYRRRWQAELNLRSLKTVLQMDVLRSESPALVRKEVWAHLLAYNLIRGLMAEAAVVAGVQPWQISFKGTLQTFRGFIPELLHRRGAARHWLWQAMLESMSKERVGNRPDRHEPRRKKRRAKPYPLLTEPRHKARARLEL